MLQFEFSFLICPDALDALNARALAEPHGHNRRQELLAFKASSLETQRETQREGTTGCYNGETQREKKNGEMMQNEKCHFYSL